jgi:hypothetical protein
MEPVYDRVERARVRTPLRVLGYVLGPLFCASAPLAALLEAMDRIHDGTGSITAVLGVLPAAIGGSAIGILILYAARTGIDPFGGRPVFAGRTRRAADDRAGHEEP